LELIYHPTSWSRRPDAATRTYACGGAGVVWAVLDSGIDGRLRFATSEPTVDG